jgi:quercetin dioxygenase-like cupin family protein
VRRLGQGVALAAVLLAAGSGAAAPVTFHRTTMEDQPFPAPYHTTTVRTVVAVHGAVPPHTHPGLEMAYILRGKAEFDIAGQLPLTLPAGDSVAITEGRVHGVRNVGSGPLIILSTYVLKVGEPLASPAPTDH